MNDVNDVSVYGRTRAYHCRMLTSAPVGCPAMYSVEITVEKDLVTGETKVLSTNTLLPKDLSHQGVKVYEDEQKGDWIGNI